MTSEQAEILTAEDLRLETVKDATVAKMNFEGAWSVFVEFSNGIVARLYPADDHWTSFVGDKVLEIVHSNLGEFYFLRIKFYSGKIGLFQIRSF